MATKRLALELGLVQKRKVNGGQTSASKATQEFDYLVVLDFESTCWETGPRMSRQEIIEFPAVLLHLATGKIISEFQQYVMPVEQPILSEFCTTLTGITQDQVEAGMPLAACLSLFSTWIRKACDEHQISFNTSLPGKHVTFATWTDWDLGVCLHYECSRKQLRKPEFFNQWMDVKLTYKDFYHRRPQGLAGALKDLGISFEGREHSGICDTRNTAVLISRMARDGCVLKITKSLSSKVKGNSVKEAAQKLFNQVKNVVTGKRTSEGIQDESKSKRLAKSKAASVNSSAQNELEGGQEKQVVEKVTFNLRLIGNNSVIANRETEKKADISDMQKTSVTSKVLSHPLRSITNVVQREMVSRMMASTSASTSPKLLSYTKSDPFKTPCLPNTHHGTRMSVGLSKSSATMRTPPMCQSNVWSTSAEGGKNYHMYKRTPPFCGCGRRAKLLLTCKPGPNEGRHFFSCPNGGTANKKGCKFFKWEDEPFVKTPLMNPYCTPFSNLNSKFSAQSVPARQMMKVSGIGAREAVSEPNCNKMMRCIGLSRNSLSQQKAAMFLSNIDHTRSIAQQRNGDSSVEPYEITPFVVRQESRVKRDV